jgi:hypothetical protein
MEKLNQGIKSTSIEEAKQSKVVDTSDQAAYTEHLKKTSRAQEEKIKALERQAATESAQIEQVN